MKCYEHIGDLDNWGALNKSERSFNIMVFPTISHSFKDKLKLKLTKFIDENYARDWDNIVPEAMNIVFTKHMNGRLVFTEYDPLKEYDMKDKSREHFGDIITKL